MDVILHALVVTSGYLSSYGLPVGSRKSVRPPATPHTSKASSVVNIETIACVHSQHAVSAVNVKYSEKRVNTTFKVTQISFLVQSGAHSELQKVHLTVYPSVDISIHIFIFTYVLKRPLLLLGVLHVWVGYFFMMVWCGRANESFMRHKYIDCFNVKRGILSTLRGIFL